MKSHNRVPKLTSPTGSTLEVLESRIAPATLSAPGTFTYTDGDGDIVKVNVAGKFTSVDFLNGLGEDVVASGGDVASVVVSGAGCAHSSLMSVTASYAAALRSAWSWIMGTL